MSGFTHETAGSPEWYTPPEIFAALGLTFDLDPCAPPYPLASDTPWWQAAVARAHAVCFIAGACRVHSG